MPATYQLDVAHRLVWSRAWGTITNDELAAHSKHLRANPRFAPDFRQLQDLTEIREFKVTSAGLQNLARLNPFGKGARRAVLVASNLAFGLARMHEMLRGNSADELRVFRQRALAMEWLELPADWTPPPPAPDDPVFDSGRP